jgi:predicted ATPase
MSKIGFQNFRRFKYFEPLEYEGITFLVGRNNSGKSTLVKALILIDNFFKSEEWNEFSFGGPVLEDANIATYGRARNFNAKDEDFIKFYYQTLHYIVEITITGEDDKSFGRVIEFKLTDEKYNLQFLFKPQTRSLSVTKTAPDNKLSDVKNTLAIHDLENEIKKTETELAQSSLKKSDREYLLLIDSLNTLKKKKEKLLCNNLESGDDIADLDDRLAAEEKKKGKLFSKDKSEDSSLYSFHQDFMEDVIYVDEDSRYPNSYTYLLISLLSEAERLHDDEFVKIHAGQKPSKDFVNYRGIKEDKEKIKHSFDTFVDSIKSKTVIYLGANPAKQSALFNIRDRNNALVQAINEFYQLKILPGEPAYEFVKKWISLLEVGQSFGITIHAGEAYEVKITNNDTEVYLADMGMGSIQAMLLILRLACIIHITSHKTVLIEEPELNLHPALQSKLADLFLEVHNEYFIDFIIETHSEYLIRKTQVLVAMKEYEVAPNKNPFCVYYFPNETEYHPYELTYDEYGIFRRNFGDGFFDVASSNTLKLLRLKRDKQG